MAIRCLDEGGFAAAEGFLSTFLPAAATTLERYLGRGVGEPVHVILSETATHERRFPPKEDEILGLVEPETLEEFEDENIDARQTLDEHRLPRARDFPRHRIQPTRLVFRKWLVSRLFEESGRQDLNLRPPGPQPEGSGCLEWNSAA
jgi:hypothetical protein